MYFCNFLIVIYRFVSKIYNFAEVMSLSSMTPQERSVLYRTTMPIGTEFESNGVRLRCVLRPEIEYPRDACSGCFYSRNYVTCPKSQCSSIGRNDGKSVWFVEVGELSKEEKI